MSKQRLIQRLKWYYPLERFHTYVTVPVTIVFLLLSFPARDLIFMTYGLVVCTVILFQGQLYWKLKLDRLLGKSINQQASLSFFRKSKRVNVVLIIVMLPVFLVQLFVQEWDVSANNLMTWSIVANAFAILEHINYYHIQLMIDNEYDAKYLITNKRLKKSSLAKDLQENKI